MVEIYASGLEKVLKDLAIEGELNYKGKGPFNSTIEIWETTEEDLEKLSDQPEQEFFEKYIDFDEDTFWRYAEGSNMGSASIPYIINGEEVLAWDGVHAEDWAIEDEAEGDGMPREYNKLLEYFCDEIGASTEKNICALAVDMAKYNNMTMAELFKKYQGE